MLANEHPHDAAVNTESGPKAAPLDGKAATTRSAAEPVDNDLVLSYQESRHGQLLEEGITEAGALSSWVAAGTSYATRGVPMVPFFTFYSMFGFQRVGDLIWAAGADAWDLATALGETRSRFDARHFVELGIGCESCHNGGRDHVADPTRHPSYAPVGEALSVRLPRAPADAESERVLLFAREDRDFPDHRDEAGQVGVSVA